MPEENKLSDTIEQIKSFLIENASEFIINLILAFLIFYIGKKVAKVLTNISLKIMEKAKLDDVLCSFLSTLVNISLMLIVIMATLSQLGVNMMGLGAILAAAGLAIGLSLQGTLSNFAAGVMIVLFKPFKVGDFVNIAGETGVIEEVHIFNTVLKTGDNVQITIPNSSIIGGNVTNFSAKSTRRIDLVIGCGYDDNLKEVKNHLESLIQSKELILKDPAPVIAVAELGDSSVNFVVRPWVKSEDYWAVRWELLEEIKTSFDEKGFSIPYPQRDVHIHNAKEV
ncbi:mechanosensitive ion channel [Lentisphaera marina]|uniref:mechanosensitive ion channel family protein n=1 Tax=Lentisphaera marina TaxID=1111041 RepID=UPI00236623E3|nr:mechanosensitive ion channel domain-containing protein [Lentisphaera marina]MDD7984064.1 mechanosensitive ion channel [Lentisphaera marina]